MNNDWETRWLPPLTLGIIRVTSLWLDQKNKKQNLFDIIAESTLGMMAYLPGGGGGGGVVDNHHCRVNLYFPPTAVSWILN